MYSSQDFKTPVPLGEDGLSVAIPVSSQLRPVFTKDAPFTLAMSTQDDFQPVRVIGTLKFVDQEGREQNRGTFVPPAQLRVPYTLADVFHAMRRGKPLVLADWQGDHWVRLEQGYSSVWTGGPEEGPFAYFQLREIVDPPICWGT